MPVSKGWGAEENNPGLGRPTVLGPEHYHPPRSFQPMPGYPPPKSYLPIPKHYPPMGYHQPMLGQHHSLPSRTMPGYYSLGTHPQPMSGHHPLGSHPQPRPEYPSAQQVQPQHLPGLNDLVNSGTALLQSERLANPNPGMGLSTNREMAMEKLISMNTRASGLPLPPIVPVEHCFNPLLRNTGQQNIMMPHQPRVQTSAAGSNGHPNVMPPRLPLPQQSFVPAVLPPFSALAASFEPRQQQAETPRAFHTQTHNVDHSDPDQTPKANHFGRDDRV